MTAKSYSAVLERAEEIAPQTRALFLRLAPGRGLEFQPGQFLSLSIPSGEKGIVRAYSIASHPEEPELLEICLNLVPAGPGSTYLFALTSGARVDFTGPWGTFVLDTPPARNCVMIAEGAGIVPFRPMIRRALAGRDVEALQLLHAVSDEHFLLYRSELEARAAADRRFRFEPLVEGGGDHEHLQLLDLVRQRYVDAGVQPGRNFYICGVGDVVTRLRDLLRGAGYERRTVHYEKW